MELHIDESILKQAMRAEIEDRMQKIPEHYYEPHEFSRKFERRMKYLIKNSQYSKLTRVFISVSKRVAVIILVILSISISAVLSVQAYRVKFFKFIQQQFKEYSVIFLEPETNSLLPIVMPSFNLSFIPEKFEKVVDIKKENEIRLAYTDDNDHRITYRQSFASRISPNINTEDTELVKIEYRGDESYYYENNGNYTVMWVDGMFYFSVSCNIDKETLFKIADGVKIAQ